MADTFTDRDYKLAYRMILMACSFVAAVKGDHAFHPSVRNLVQLMPQVANLVEADRDDLVRLLPAALQEWDLLAPSAPPISDREPGLAC